MILPLLFLSILPSLYADSSCSSYVFSTDESFDSCTELPYLGATLHWSYEQKPGTLRAGLRVPQKPNGWVAWGVNPSAEKMAGTQAIVAFRHSNGSMTAYTTPIDGYSPAMAPGELSLPVYSLAADYVKGEMIILATLGLLGNNTEVNHVWQAGSSVLDDVPQKHDTSGDNLKSVGRISFG